MTARARVQSRRLATFGSLTLTAIALWAVCITPAAAAETTVTAVQSLQRGPLLAFTCTDCHATIKDNLVPDHIFSHGAHMTYDCTACHPRFPHTRAGTERPGMASCFSCHGLRHGPQGIIAKSDCSKCHTKPRAQLVPKDHLAPDFNGKGHVAPSKAMLRENCMMCHTKSQCDTCHFRTNVSWETTLTYVYDSGNGCLSCHKSALPRLSAPVTASKLDSSAHRDLTCGQCHPDFRYDDAANKTKLWNVNAGLACGAKECHPKQQSAWAPSVHGVAVLSGKDLTAATCSGCHAGHDIERLKTQGAKNRLRLSGEKSCVGSCHTHQAAYTSYADWWHGDAYKAGSLDAPACWTCHGAHETKALKDPKSMTSPELLPGTCGQEGCHGGATEEFVETWRTLAHGRTKAIESNPLANLRASLFSGGK